MITVNELMTPDPYTLHESDTLHDAWEIMTDKRIRHIPIINDNNHLLGLITQRDVLAATRPSQRTQAGNEKDSIDSNVKLSDIMIKDVTTIHKEDNLRQAALHMQSHKHGCLPVIYEDRLVGIITDSDFVSIAINLLEQVELLEEQNDEDSTMDDVDLASIKEGSLH